MNWYVPSTINHDQSEAVRKLKTQFREKGLTKDFESEADFRTKFSDDLSFLINDSDNYFTSCNNNNLTLKIDKPVNRLSDEAIELLFASSKDDG